MGLNLKDIDLSDLPDQPRDLARGREPVERPSRGTGFQPVIHGQDAHATILDLSDLPDQPAGLAAPSLIQTPEPSFFQRAMNFLTGAGQPNRTASARARAANIVGLAQAEGITPAQAEDRYLEAMHAMGFDPGPSTADLAFFALGTGLGMAAAEPAVAAALGLKGLTLSKLGLGVAQFTAVKKAVDKASDLAARYVPWDTPTRTGEPGPGGLAALLPAHSSETVTGLLEIAEFLLEGKAAAGLTKLEGQAWDAVASRVFRNLIEEKGLPRNIWFSAGQVRTVFNAPEGKVTVEEMDLIRSLGLSAREYHDAMDHGLDITIPAERVVKLADKPWWGRIKAAFRLRPYEEVVAMEKGQPVRIAGRLPAPGEAAPEAAAGGPSTAQELPAGQVEPSKPGPAEGAAVGQEKAPGPEIVERVFDTSRPPYPDYDPSNDNALGMAGWYQDGRIHTVHVTSDPQAALDALKGKGPLTLSRAGGDTGDLGGGLYGSAAPNIWMGRATKKWSFLPGLTDEQKIALGDALGKEILREVQDHYISESEAETAYRDIDQWLKGLSPDAVIFLADQPYNIKFWEKDYLSKLGIEPGQQPAQVPMELEGSFAQLRTYPTEEQVNQLRQAGFDGAFLKSSFGAMPQLVVWNKAAVVRFGGYERPPQPVENAAPAEAPEEFDELARWIAESEAQPTIALSAIAEYEQLQAQARARAAERAPDLLKAQKLRALRGVKTAAKAQAREIIADLPVYQAMDAAVQGGGLRWEDLRKDYDRDTLTQLARKRPGLIKHGGHFRPDEFAVEHGFEGGVDELVEAMLDAPTKGAAIENAADQALREYEDAWMEEAADISLETLEQEISILNEMLGKKPHVAKGIKKFIREQTGQVRTGRLVDEAKALKAAFKKAEQASRIAWRAGRRDVVLTMKERQKALIERLRDRYKARDEIRAIDQTLNRYARLTTLPYEYKDQLLALLLRHYRIPKSFHGRPIEKSLRAFLQEKADAGEEGAQIALSLEERLPPEQSRAGLTLEEVQVVKDLADILVHLGRTENKLLKAGQLQDLQETLARINAVIARNHPAPPPDFTYTPAPGERRLSWLGELREAERVFMAGRVKPEFIFRAMDGWEDLGPVWSELFQPIKQAEDAEMLLGAAKLKEIQDAFDRVLAGQTEPIYPVPGTPGRADWEALGPGWADVMMPEAPASPAVLAERRRGLKAHAWANTKYRTPGIPQTLRKEEIVMVALNSGNEGNRAALRSGFRKEDGTGWTDEDIDRVTAHLTAAEWGLVESVWQTIDSLYEPLAETFTALTGARLKRVEGRYFPLVFDRDLAYKADRFQAEADARDFFKTIYTKPKPQDSMTIERTGGRMPPLLTFSVIPRHIQATVHYLTHALPVRNISRIISNDGFRQSVGRAPGLGDPAWRQLMPWLQEVARPRREPLNDVEKVLQWIRRNATAVNMGFKATVAFVQPLALTQAIPQLGEYQVLKGLSDFYTDPWATRDFIIARSPMMRFRAQQFDRDLNQLFNRFDARLLSRWDEFKHHAFDAISLMDKSATYPVWMAAYEKGLNQYDGDEEKAVEFADMIVRTTQGTGMPKDLAGWQRGGELAKLLTMFYSFFSVYANQMYELGFRYRLGDASLLDWFKAHAWLTIIPALVSFVLYERRLPTSKEAVAEMLAYRLSGLPIIRDMAGAMSKGYDYRISPIESAPKSALNLISALTKPKVKERGRKIMRYSLETGGYLTGLPSAQAVITMEGILDLLSGKTSDPTRLLFRESREPKE